MTFDHAKWRRENRDSIYKKANQWRKENPERRLWMGAKSRAKGKGIPFDITVDDVVIPIHCPYLGIPLTNEPDKSRPHSNPSLDRIDPHRGYEKGNVQVLSNLANRMKADATWEQLVAFSETIIRINKELSEVRDSN